MIEIAFFDAYNGRSCRWMLCAEVGVEVEAGAGVRARAGVGALIVVIGGNHFSLTEIEAGQEFQLNCAKIL